MQKMFVVSTHPVVNTRAHGQDMLDMNSVETRPITFDQAFLYWANDAAGALEKASHSIFGPNYAVSAREFSPEEYARAFEKCDIVKLAWLKEVFGLGPADENPFDKLSSKRLRKVVELVSVRTGVPAEYRIG